MVAAKHPQIVFLYHGGPCAGERYLGHVFDLHPIDALEKRVGICEPSWIEDHIDRVIVRAIVHLLYETVMQRLDPLFADRTIVELTPKGAARRVYQVHLHIS